MYKIITWYGIVLLWIAFSTLELIAKYERILMYKFQ